MRKIIVVLFALGLLVFCNGAVRADRTGPEKVAAAYFEALTSGDVDKANSLAAAPFSFDGKETLKSMEEVRERHQSILTKKGKRTVPEYTLTTVEKSSPLDAKLFPEHVTVRITLAGGDEHVDVYVTRGDPPKVIGFRD